MRDELTRLGCALPALRAGRQPGGRGGIRRRGRAGRWCSRRSAAVTTAAASGCATGRIRRPRCWRHGVALLAEEHRRRSSASWPRWSPGPRTGQGAAYPVVQTVQRDGVCREVLAPAPGLAAAAAEDAQRLALRIADELGVTGLLAVELFETPRRPAGQRAGHAAAQQRSLDHRGGGDLASSSSTCGRCSTCRWARRSRSRRTWSWPTCSGPRTWPAWTRTCTTATST